MRKKYLRFGYIETERYKFFHHSKSPVFKKDMDIEKVLVSKKISSGEKKFGYLFNT